MATTVFSQTPTNYLTGNTGLSVRQVIPTSVNGQGQVSVTFDTVAGAAFSTGHCSIGVLSGAVGSSTDTVATPVELTFSGAHGFSLAAGASIQSDWVNLAWTAGQYLVVIMDVTSNDLPYRGGYSTSTYALALASTTSYNEATVTGFSNNLGNVAGFSLVQTQSGVTAVIIDLGCALDAGATMHAGAIASAESSAGAAAAAALGPELLAGAAGSPMVPLDLLLLATAAAAAGAETTSARRVDLSLDAEALRDQRRDGVPRFEIAAGVRRDAPAAGETVGFVLALGADSAIRLEIARTVTGRGPVRIDTTAAFAAAAFAAAEALVMVPAAERAALIELLGMVPIATDAVVALDLARRFSVDAAGAFESFAIAYPAALVLYGKAAGAVFVGAD